jgi:acetyl/propionyl-CoA carboxylase alpha subunit
VEFLREVVLHPEFIAGNTYTDFIPKHFDGWKMKGDEEGLDWALIAAGIHSYNSFQKKGVGGEVKREYSPWLTVGSWEIMGGK